MGKLFHQILSDRIGKYLVGNGYLDVETQKVFVGKISGCEDHNLVMGEIVTVGEKNLDGLLILLIFLKSGSNLGSSVMLVS